MIRSTIAQVLLYHLPAGRCSLVLRAAPKEVTSEYGVAHGTLFVIGCNCLPAGVALGMSTDIQHCRQVHGDHATAQAATRA